MVYIVAFILKTWQSVGKNYWFFGKFLSLNIHTRNNVMRCLMTWIFPRQFPSFPVNFPSFPIIFSHSPSFPVFPRQSPSDGKCQRNLQFPNISHHFPSMPFHFPSFPVDALPFPVIFRRCPAISHHFPWMPCHFPSFPVGKRNTVE